MSTTTVNAADDGTKDIPAQPVIVSDIEPPLLRVKDLATYLFTKHGVGKAVDGVSFDLRPGETVGLLGESGSGKSMTLLSIVGLIPPGARIVAGHVLLRGVDLIDKSQREMRTVRGREIAMILQDSLGALDPVFSIGYQIYEALHTHSGLNRRQARDRSIQLLTELRVPFPRRQLGNYPHQLSGGMRQRVVGAIAIGPGPAILLADEPTTSLDATVQIAYLDLLKEVQERTRLGIVFVTHDFGVLADICDRAVVMYAGKMVESGAVRTLLDAPAHPYTRALLEALPNLTGKNIVPIEGQPPSVFSIPRGCPFAARCRHVMSRCHQEFPPERVLGPQHSVSCWLYE